MARTIKTTIVFTVLLAMLFPVACSNNPVPVIFDTDMGNDIDDALAQAMLYRYADEGKVYILCVASSKTDTTSVRYVNVLNNWYGYPDIPVGKLTGIEQYRRDNPYTKKVCEWIMLRVRTAGS